jgi:AcrR family transcriptional regulator
MLGAMPPTRRERARAATLEEIKRAALEQIATVGGAGLSLRGVARAIGMSPAGLYRYYDGRDALLTDLIADAYGALAAALEEAAVGSAGATAPARLLAVAAAYRRWALDHPSRFLLIFGTPVPGYAAPEGGPTTVAMQRVGFAFLSVAAAGLSAGELRAPARRTAPNETRAAGSLPAGFPAEAVAPLLGLWGSLHGLVTLELVGQLDWAFPAAETFFEAEMSAAIARWAPAG